jgi:UDP-2,3-diacylglucosamine pyrophosphatase LpxH
MTRSMLVSLLWLAASLGCSGGSAAPEPLAFSASIRLSDAGGAPLAVDPPGEIRLTFGEPLLGATVPGAVRLQAARPGGAWVDEPPMDVTWDPARPAEIVVRARDGRPLPGGEGFRLTVGSRIRSMLGRHLATDAVGYFATDHAFVLGPNPLVGAGADRSVIYAISDIHMGDGRSISEGYGWLIQNRDAVQEFLALAGQSPDLKELVIAGDLFDEWVAPMITSPLDGGTESAFVASIARANPGIVSAMNDLVQGGQVRVTYVPGNHDMLVQRAEVEGVFPGILQARDESSKGLGAYSPPEHPEMVFEHGHRWDFFNAPDPISNRAVTGGGSILPPGFFVTKIAATSEQDYPKLRGLLAPPTEPLAATVSGTGEYVLYGLAWGAVMIGRPVKASWKDRIIATGIDGYVDPYAIDDFIPFLGNGGLDVNVYKGIEATWEERQVANGVQVPVPKAIAMIASAVGQGIDLQAETQYFQNPLSTKRIVVFGHTHDVRLTASSNLRGLGAVYANSGTWVDQVDSKGSRMTFVVIVPPRSGSVLTTVSTWEFRPGQPPVKIDSAALID